MARSYSCSFQLPGGKWAAVAWASVPFLFSLSYWFIALTDNEVVQLGAHGYKHVKVSRRLFIASMYPMLIIRRYFCHFSFTSSWRWLGRDSWHMVCTTCTDAITRCPSWSRP